MPGSCKACPDKKGTIVNHDPTNIRATKPQAETYPKLDQYSVQSDALIETMRNQTNAMKSTISWLIGGVAGITLAGIAIHTVWNRRYSSEARLSNANSELGRLTRNPVAEMRTQLREKGVFDRPYVDSSYTLSLMTDYFLRQQDGNSRSR